MSKSSKLCLAVVVAASTLAALGVVGTVAQAGNFVSEADYDFDCDGVRDLVDDQPYANVDGADAAGKVTVTYSKTGTTQEISQATPGVPGTPEQSDRFGWAHTAYDRDQDGCDELVVGVPYEGIGSQSGAGTVTIVPGTPTGLDPSRSEGHTQGTSGIPGKAENADWFGRTLAAGRTLDGTPYLLIGAPGEDSSSVRDHGLVYYLRSGSVTAIHQDSPGVPGAREAGDYFGESLAVSDRYFVIGTPQETVNAGRAGMVHVFSHTLTSGMPTPVAGFHQDSAGISGDAERGDLFGWRVSVIPYRPGSTLVGALVAVGVAEEDIASTVDAGMAHLVYVSPDGAVTQLAALHQDMPGVTGAPEAGDSLGNDVVVASLDTASSVAEPDTTVWAVAVGFEETANGNSGAAHVLRATWQPGNPDIWLEGGRYGLPLQSLYAAERLRASATHLHVGAWLPPCYAVPWRNLLEDATDPVIPQWDSCL